LTLQPTLICTARKKNSKGRRGRCEEGGEFIVSLQETRKKPARGKRKRNAALIHRPPRGDKPLINHMNMSKEKKGKPLQLHPTKDKEGRRKE